MGMKEMTGDKKKDRKIDREEESLSDFRRGVHSEKMNMK